MQKVIAPSVIIAASLMVEAKVQADKPVVQDTKSIHIFIGSYTEQMAGQTLGVSPNITDGKANLEIDPLGEGIYSAELAYRRVDAGVMSWTFSSGSRKLVHNSTNVHDVDGDYYLGKNPSFVKVVPDREILLATNEYGDDNTYVGGVQSFSITILMYDEHPSDQRAFQNFDSIHHEGARSATYIDILTDSDNRTQYFGVAEYGGIAQQFKFGADSGLSDFNVNNSTQTDFRKRCFRYVPQSILKDDTMCLALVSANDNVRQLDCTNGLLQEVTTSILPIPYDGYDLPVTAASHIDFAHFEDADYVIVVSENGDSSDTDRVGSHVDNPPKIQSFVYDSNRGYFNKHSKNSTSLLPDGDFWRYVAKKEDSPLYNYLVHNGKFGAKGSDVHVHPTNSSTVYASTLGYDRIVRFHLDSVTGSLTRIKEYSTSVYNFKGYTPRTFEIVEDPHDKDKYFMLVSNQDGGNIALFNIKADGDDFGDLEAVDVLPTPFPTSTSAFIN